MKRSCDTGELVWSKRVVGVNEQLNLKLGFMILGNKKMDNNMHEKAMDIAAQKMVDAMVKDMTDVKLLLRR